MYWLHVLEPHCFFCSGEGRTCNRSMCLVMAISHLTLISCLTVHLSFKLFFCKGKVIFKSIYFHASFMISFFSQAESNSIPPMYQVFLIFLSVDSHQVWFHFLTVVNQGLQKQIMCENNILKPNILYVNWAHLTYHNLKSTEDGRCNNEWEDKI